MFNLVYCAAGHFLYTGALQVPFYYLLLFDKNMHTPNREETSLTGVAQLFCVDNLITLVQVKQQQQPGLEKNLGFLGKVSGF